MKINQRVFVLREAITKVVPMLAQKRIAVTFRGFQAFVEYDDKTGAPKRVNLPSMPDDASDELIDAVQGFLDHEVAHCLFSDVSVLDDAIKQGEEVKFFANAIEDTMIERRMADRFTGSAFNLANTSRFFLKERVDPALKLARQQDDDGESVLGNLMVPAIRAWAKQGEFDRYMRDGDKWNEIKDFVNAVGEDLIERIPKCNSSRECLDLAVEMHKRVSKGTPPEPPPPPPEPEDGEGDPGKGEEGEGEGAPSGGEGEGEPSDNGESPNLRPEMNSEGIPEKLSGAINKAVDFDEAVAEALSARAEEEAKNSEYVVFTTDDDTIAPMPSTAASVAAIPKMMDEVDEMLGPMKADLERMFAAKTLAVWTGGHKRGRLHGAALTRAKFGAVDLFRRKQENTLKHSAVSLVVDCSGSMCGSNKIQTACYSAFALASVLERIGIPCEVLGFSTKPHSAAVQADLHKAKNVHDFARLEAINMPIFKDFDERLSTDVKGRFTYAPMARDLCMSNIDGESVMMAARRLMARKETRKIMIVLSDGQPAGHGYGDYAGHLKETVKRIEAANVDVVGIGIMDKSVERFYKKNVTMRDVRELPSIVTGQLKAMLFK
jgi:cobaltochelatase CobT